MPSTLIVGEVIHTHDLSKYSFVKGGAANHQWCGGRGLIGGGGPSATDAIQYVNIGIVSNAADFGELAEAKAWLRATSDASRGVWLGASGTQMDYKNILVVGGSATDFGDASGDRDSPGTASNGSRAAYGGDWPPSNVLDYIEISHPANAVDFGELSQARGYVSCNSDGTRGVWAYGYSSGESPDQPNVLDYKNIENVGGTATDFGDCSTAGRYHVGNCSDGYRGLYGGGSLPPGASDVIDYITISLANGANAIDFGNLSQGRNHLDGTEDGQRGLFTGGSPGIATLDYVDIGVLCNAIDFGDLYEGTTAPGSCSGG